jgi:hypothetical protein
LKLHCIIYKQQRNGVSVEKNMTFIIFDDIVYIRQWDEFLDKFNVIAMSPEMFDDFRVALNSSEGAYFVKK